MWSFAGKVETTLFLDPDEFTGMSATAIADHIRGELTGADFTDDEGKVQAVARLIQRKAAGEPSAASVD